MRKVVVSSIVSLDGYVAGSGGDVMALPMDPFFDEHNVERQRRADTLMLGRTTYLGLKAYWPAVAADPSLSPAVQLDPSTADLHREIGQRNDALPKVVVSDTLTADDTAPWTATTTIVRRADAHAGVRELKGQGGGDILVFGSRTLWSDLLVAGLVDELHLLVAPVALRDGLFAYSSGPNPAVAPARRTPAAGVRQRPPQLLRQLRLTPWPFYVGRQDSHETGLERRAWATVRGSAGGSRSTVAAALASPVHDQCLGTELDVSASSSDATTASRCVSNSCSNALLTEVGEPRGQLGRRAGRHARFTLQRAYRCRTGRPAGRGRSPSWRRCSRG